MEVNRTLEVTISTPDRSVENNYKFEYPTIQQMIDIESMKISLSKGKYSEMILTGTRWMDRALNYVDMVAYFSVLCPDILRDMKVDIRQINVLDAQEGLMNVFLNQFLPWWSEYETLLKDLESDKDSEDGSKKPS
jgi:hypothetical protein